ncbi:MAG: DoxX family protein [Erythrobacter sp.]
MATVAAIVGRILLGALFVFAGLGKVMDTAGTAAYMEAESPFPGSMALAVGVFEIVAGLVLASGFMTRIASLALVVFTALATLFFHEQVTDQVQAAMALKNLAIVGGLLMVFAYGQQRSRIEVVDERAKRLDAEVRAAHAEGKAEGAGGASSD